MPGTSCPRGLPLALSVAAAAVLGACANAVTITPALVTLVFKIQVNGQISQSQDLRYIFVFDDSGDPNDGPKPYGPWPEEKPLFGWDLPFYITPDTPGVSNLFNPLPEPNVWTDLFMLRFPGGQTKFEHWEQILDADKKRSAIQPRPDLVLGQDYKITRSETATTPGGLDTIELTLLLNRFVPADKLLSTPKEQLEANLVIQVEPPASATNGIPSGWKIDQWFTLNNEYFSISLDCKRPAELKTALDSQPLFPQNIPPGMNPDDVIFKSYSSEVQEQGC